MKFYNREQEIKALLGACERRKAEMVIITGRRRVGKTRLMDELLKRKRGSKVLVVPKQEKQVAQDFVEAIQKETGYAPPLNSMKDFLEYFFRNPEIQILCIDEFPNFLEVNKSVVYEFQKYWDEYKDSTDKVLVLTGSYVGMMNKIFTKRKAPLFNRAGVSISLQPLDLPVCFEALGDIGIKDPKERIAAYCIFGGVPLYFELIENRVKDGKSIYDIVEELFFEAGAPLKEEGDNILRQEFGDSYKKYFAVLEAISSGVVSLTEISDKLGIRPTTLAKYLLALQRDFKLVNRHVPYGQSISRSKKGLYRIEDNTMAFWFSLVYGKQTTPDQQAVDLFISKRFETICRLVLARFIEKKGETPGYLGSWWGFARIGEKAEQREIDVIAETDECLYIGSVKWTNKKMTQSDLEWLQSSSSELVKRTKKKVVYALFSREGFAVEEKENVLLFDCKRINDILVK